jgi:GST-like protein
MIHAYSAPTANGHKLHIMLEECGGEYDLHRINFGDGDQFKPDFLKVSPNNKIPAIRDEDGPGGAPVSVFESGAILIYLAEKTGQFLPDAASDPRGRLAVLEWLMW